jgi:hypothetical protein
VSAPVIGADGKVAFIIHRAEDVTAFVTAQGRIAEGVSPRLSIIGSSIWRRRWSCARRNSSAPTSGSARKSPNVPASKESQPPARTARSAQEDERRRSLASYTTALASIWRRWVCASTPLRARVGDAHELAAQIEELQTHAA